MNITRLFKQKDKEVTQSIKVDPEQMPEPSDLAGFMRRGWAYHARKQEDFAEADFRRALAIDPRSVDASYGLGLILKAQGRKDEAINAFRKTLELIADGAVEDRIRAEMLRRLSLGHINELSIGDWNLEEMVWHRRT